MLRVRLLSEVQSPQPRVEPPIRPELDGRSRDSLVDLHIVPWALTNEDTPIHIQWRPEFDFDAATIAIPPGYVFVEFTNVSKVELKENKATIQRTDVEQSNLSRYFGCVIRRVTLPQEIRYEGNVEFSFTKGETVIRNEILKSRIFRPKLTFSETPAPVELTDREAGRSLPIHIGYRGFGDIQLRVEAIMGGQIVSEASTVALEILRRLWMYDTLPQEEHRDAQKPKVGVTPDYVKAIAAEVERILDTGEIPSEFFEEEVLADIKEWLTDIRNRDRFMDLLYSNTEDMLLNMLMELLDSHPASNVSLVTPKSKILTHIRAPLTNIVLRLRYRDLLKNEYEPVEVTINLVDKRTKGKAAVEVPIVITKWDDRPLMNVAGI